MTDRSLRRRDHESNEYRAAAAGHGHRADPGAGVFRHLRLFQHGHGADARRRPARRHGDDDDARRYGGGHGQRRDRRARGADQHDQRHREPVFVKLHGRGRDRHRVRHGARHRRRGGRRARQGQRRQGESAQRGRRAAHLQAGHQRLARGDVLGHGPGAVQGQGVLRRQGSQGQAAVDQRRRQHQHARPARPRDPRLDRPGAPAQPRPGGAGPQQRHRQQARGAAGGQPEHRPLQDGPAHRRRVLVGRGNEKPADHDAERRRHPPRRRGRR